MAALLVTLFFCLPPQVYLYPAAQRCSVILPEALLQPVASSFSSVWSSQPFSSFFSSCGAYLMSFYGGRRRWGERHGAVLHRMRAYWTVPHIFRSSGRSSKLSTSSDRSWFCWQAPLCGSQLMLLLFISWCLLLLLLGMPCQVTGASELLRVDGQGGYAEDWHRSGTKGTDVLAQLSGINGGRYKHGEPPPGRAEESFPSKLRNELELKGAHLSARLDSLTTDDLGIKQVLSLESNTGEKTGGQSAKLGNLERFHFGNLIRDCLKVKCSPLASLDVKQSSLEETPPFKGGPPTFQGPLSSAPSVAIVPPFLEWGSQPIFAPSIASLTVVNTCNSTRLKVFQPFSTDLQFYTSGFEEKVVEPGGELSIPIVFLPRALGVSEAMVIVQTSAGGFLVQAQGRGVGSPYEVQSLQGLRVASGETLQYTISLHNPHDEVLRVGEVYAWPREFAGSSLSDSNSVVRSPCARETVSSSGGSGCLESHGGAVLQLASEQQDARGIPGGAAVIQMRPPGQLEIRPHSSNAIAEFEFAALKADRYFGSLHIKLLLGKDGSDNVLILPIDVQVGESKGDASPVEPVLDVLEFGILTREDQTSKVDVVLYNPGTEAVQVEDISLLLEDENIIHIEYMKGLVLPPNRETEVAVVTYMGIEETVPSGLFECHPRELLRDRKLIVRTNSSVSPKVEVPYRALVFHGSVQCDPVLGSVGFVPQRSNGVNGDGEGSSILAGGALSEQQRVHFVTGLNLPLSFFMELERRARTTALYNTPLVPSVSKTDIVCCHEVSTGYLAVSVSHLSILLQADLLYPVVQIGAEELHWVNVTNPSDKPIYVKVLVGSKVEASDRTCQQNGVYTGDSCSDFPDSKVMCHSPDNPSNIFSWAKGAVVDAIVEPYGTVALGPVVFRPLERCLWTGLLSVWNNLTQVEWLLLQGSGGSGSLTFLNGDYPLDLLQLDFNVTQSTLAPGVLEEQAGEIEEAKKGKAVCAQRVSTGFWAKNTGDLYLDVKALELVGGGCSAYGFEVSPCRGFSLAPGQSTELVISFKPDFSKGIFQRDLQLITSAGIIQIPLLANFPEHIFPLCSEMSQSTKLERAFLYLAVVALVVVLGVFFRMLAQEMSREQMPGNGLKSVPQQKVGGRQMPPITSTPTHTTTHAVVVTKTSNSVVMAGRLKCSSGEPEVQSRTGDGTGASGPGRPKDSMKGLVRALKGVADTLTSSIGSTTGPEDKSDLAPPSGLPGGLRVKIPNPAGLSIQKSNLGSPMRETPSPSSTHFRKGTLDKRSNSARFDGLQTKITSEPLEDSLPLPVKQSTVPKSPKSVISSNTLAFTKPGADGDVSQHQQTLVLPMNSGLGSVPPMRSPKKGNQLHQLRQVLSPKAQPISPKSQPQLSSSGVIDRDKSKRKKRRSNVGTVKLESAAKGRSGSSSPSSSPASPATPASPSRPVSPLHHSDLQSNMSASSPPQFSSSKCSGGPQMTTIPPLAKLDLIVERQNSIGKPGKGNAKEPLSPPVYRRTESLSVDVASTALREMAQAKATDLSWSTLSGKGNRTTEKSNDGVIGRRVQKDWATVARKPTVGGPISGKEEDRLDDRGRDRRAWINHNGHGVSSGPTLTPSATFPRRRDRGPEWDFTPNGEDEHGVNKPVGPFPVSVPASTMPPAARAPGAKIAKPFVDVSSRDLGWGGRGEYILDGRSSSWSEIFDKKDDVSSGFAAGLSSEDQRVYDIWGNHFGEISRCSTQQIGPVRPGATDGVLQSLSVPDSTPSFFSSFPQPTVSSMGYPARSPALSGLSSGFSVFSQAPDIETFCLPSTLFNSPKTVPLRQSVFSDASVASNFAPGRNGLKGHGFGGSLPGSPRKARAPYSPPLGPSPMSSECAPLVIPETTSDLSSSFWSGSNIQDVFTTPIHT